MLESHGGAGPKELPEAAALGREPCWPGQPLACPGDLPYLQEERGAWGGVALTAPDDQPSPQAAPFASAL